MRLQLLLDLLAESPNDSFTLFALAKEYEKAVNYDEALRYYLQLRTLDPNYVGLYYHLGKLYELKDDFDMAINTYREGCEVAKAAGDRHALSELNGARLNAGDDD